MATKPKVVPQVAPEVMTEAEPTPVGDSMLATTFGPIIEYLGEGAERIKFPINPKAVKYIVRADGQIQEIF